MKSDTMKQLFVYGNVTFVVVFGMVALFSFATRQDISQDVLQALGIASIFSGFVGMGIQFLTGSEIAKRSEVAANNAFNSGATAALTVPTLPVTTTTTSEGPPATSTTVTTGTPEATDV